MQPEANEVARANQLSDLLARHMTNSKGEVLALVHEDRAFQEIYDFHGIEKLRNRLERKKEQVHNQYSARTHLFQKCYYAKDLLLEDEKQLREIFHSTNQAQETEARFTKLALAAAFFPASYRLARQVRPSTVGLFAVAYFGFYKFGVQPFSVQRMQNSLNAQAKPFAEKYGINGEF